MLSLCLGAVSETERIVSLGMLMGKLTSGTGSMAGFKEDKRNKVVPGRVLLTACSTVTGLQVVYILLTCSTEAR